MAESKVHPLEKEKIHTLLIRFSIPAIAGMIVQAVYNIVDRIFVGRYVGADGLSALTASFPLMLIFMAFGMLFGLGGSSFFSITLGEKKNEQAGKILGNTLSLVLAVTTVLAAAGMIMISPVLMVLGASSNILPLAKEYSLIILSGSVINSTAFSLNNFIRAEGSPRTAMFTMLIGGIINIVLDYLFIAVFGLGVKGAATATVIAQALSAVWVVSYFLSKKSITGLKLKNLKIEKRIAIRIFILGSAPFAMHLASSLVNGMLNNQLQRYGGDTALSVMGIVFSIMTVIIMPVFGINQGSAPIIGYNYGAEKYGRVIKAAFLSALAATLIMTSGFIITRLYPENLIILFGKENRELLVPGLAAIKIFFMMTPLIGFQVVASGYFLATGKPGKSMILSISRQVIFLIPLIIVIPLYMGLTGIWVAVAASDGISSILAGFLFFTDIKSFKNHDPIRENSESGSLSSSAI